MQSAFLVRFLPSTPRCARSGGLSVGVSLSGSWIRGMVCEGDIARDVSTLGAECGVRAFLGLEGEIIAVIFGARGRELCNNLLSLRLLTVLQGSGYGTMRGGW